MKQLRMEGRSPSFFRPPPLHLPGYHHMLACTAPTRPQQPANDDDAARLLLESGFFKTLNPELYPLSKKTCFYSLFSRRMKKSRFYYFYAMAASKLYLVHMHTTTSHAHDGEHGNAGRSKLSWPSVPLVLPSTDKNTRTVAYYVPSPETVRRSNGSSLISVQYNQCQTLQCSAIKVRPYNSNEVTCGMLRLLTPL